MELHQLRYFCAVARTKNFTRAAEQENVAQPSLSQQILKLEDELGARLFDRLPRSARLTQFGEAFLPRARDILRQLGEAKEQIREMTGIEKGRVTLGSIPTIAPYLLPSRLASFLRRHPQIEVNVVEEQTQMLLEHLHAGTIDLALLALPLPGADLVCEELLQEPLYGVIPARHPLASRKALHLKEIEDDPFLLLKSGHCFRETTITACRRARLRPNIVFEGGQFDTLFALVAAGLGVTVAPHMAVASHSKAHKGCRFIPIADERAFRRIGVVRLKHRYPTLAQRALIEHLKSGTRSRST